VTVRATRKLIFTFAGPSELLKDVLSFSLPPVNTPQRFTGISINRGQLQDDIVMGLNFIPREATSTLTLAAAKNLFNIGAFQTPLRGVTLFKFQSTNPRASPNDAAMENVPGMFGLGGNQTKEQKKQVTILPLGSVPLLSPDTVRF
jgi:hypothetical protein